jgi:hypothetical protein
LVQNFFLFQTSNKEESKKTVRNIIKISVKIGMLQRGEKFNDDEKYGLIQIQRKLRTVAMTLVSFYQVNLGE